MAYPSIFLASVGIQDLNIGNTLSTLLPFLIAAVVLGFILRGIREKLQDLSLCFSAVICVLLLYGLALLAAYFIPERFSSVLSSLPFLTKQGAAVTLYSFRANTPEDICYQVLSMLILGFAANIASAVIPWGKNLLSGMILQLLAAVLTFGVYSGAMWAFRTFLPGVLASYAPMILLVVLAVFLLIGVLRFLLGLVLTIANPIIGAIYAFFFSNKVGKQLSKAVLSTVILVIGLWGLQYFGTHQISLTDSLPGILVPGLAVLLILGNLTGKKE